MSWLTDVNWQLHREALAQVISWGAGGLVGGSMLALMGSSLDVSSPAFWVIFLLLFVVGYYLSYFHVKVKPGQDTESDLEDIRSEIAELRKEIAESTDSNNPGEQARDETAEVTTETRK